MDIVIIGNTNEIYRIEINLKINDAIPNKQVAPIIT